MLYIFQIVFFNKNDRKLIVSNLSGEEERLVSLGVALIRQPPLIVLDCPTDGLDPVLRER